MGRGRPKRTWVKLDCQGVLHGSINWLFTLEEQAVFLKLIPMAAIYCRTPGIISDNEGQPLPREFIAHELHCPVELLNSVIDKGSQDNCLRDTMNGLQLVNFEHYQFTEYDRQKPYREAKRRGREELAESTARVNTEEHMARWETLHPGKKHPARLAGDAVQQPLT